MVRRALPRTCLNLSRKVQSRNTQNGKPQRFPEPEADARSRSAPRQPPRQRLGLDRLSGKCYPGLPTGPETARLIPIAVGGSSIAFSRRSVKTGGIRNASLCRKKKRHLAPVTEASAQAGNRSVSPSACPTSGLAFPDSPFAHTICPKYFRLQTHGGQPPGLAV